MMLVDEIKERIEKLERKEKIPMRKIVEIIENIREKLEIEELLTDVVTRFLMILTGQKEVFPPKNSIVITDELYPNDIGRIINNDFNKHLDNQLNNTPSTHSYFI